MGFAMPMMVSTTVFLVLSSSPWRWDRRPRASISPPISRSSRRRTRSDGLAPGAKRAPGGLVRRRRFDPVHGAYLFRRLPKDEARIRRSETHICRRNWHAGCSLFREDRTQRKGDRPMCRGDDQNCPDFELHRKKLLDELDNERRSFLKSAFVAGGGAAALVASGGALIAPAAAQTAVARQGQPSHHYVPATADTVHWGYFSKLLKPVVEVDSRRLRHHRGAHPSRQRRRRAHGQGRSGRGERLLCGPRTRRASTGAAPGRSTASCSAAARARASACTSAPVRSSSASAEPGDILEVRIMDVKPRPSRQSQLSRARPSAATPRPGGASTTRTCSPSRSRAR